jgi:DUF1365 family protein
MHSAIYIGRLRHRRFAPRAHQFSYRLFMMYVDLAELDAVFRGRWLWSARRPALAWLRRADYIGDPARSIDAVVRDRIAAQTGTRPAGPIRMLTHLRYLGIGFNPVTFYYCFNSAGHSRRVHRCRNHQHALERAARVRAHRADVPARFTRSAVPVRQGVPRLALHAHGGRL